jgi:hypothetical protein
MTNNDNKHLTYLKENFNSPTQAFTYLEMKSLFDNQLYFSEAFELENPEIVAKIKFIQEGLQEVFDTYFNIGSDYYQKPEIYYNELIQKMKSFFSFNDEREQDAIHSILSFSSIQQKLLTQLNTYQNQTFNWQDVQNFIVKYGLTQGPFEEYEINWSNYVKQYHLNFLTINRSYNQLEASRVLVDEFKHIQDSLHIDKKHIGQKKMGITLGQVNDHDAVFYPYEFMAIKFKNISSIQNFLGHEWMHFTDRVMGISLVKSKILPKNDILPLSLIEAHCLSALKKEKLNILYPNMTALIDSFHEPLYLNSDNLAEFKKFTHYYLKQYNLEDHIKKLQEYHVLKPIKGLAKQIQVYLDNHNLYQEKFHDFLNNCFENEYLPDFRSFLFAQFDTLMELKKLNQVQNVQESDEINANLFSFYAKTCDSYLNKMNSKIYENNYTQNSLEMLARSFEIFLLDEKHKRKDDKYLYFSLPLGIEKKEFYKKWKKIGLEIKKSYLIMNPKESTHLHQKKHKM